MDPLATFVGIVTTLGMGGFSWGVSRLLSHDKDIAVLKTLHSEVKEDLKEIKVDIKEIARNTHGKAGR